MGKTKVINAPDVAWKKSILLARHSPIRCLPISFYIEDLPSYISVHFVRHHVGIEKYVKSQRNDRQSDYDRTKAPQDAPVNMIMDFNGESIQVFMQKRLCNKADPNTRKVAEEMRNILLQSNPEFEEVLKKPCQLFGRCFEMSPCNDTLK
jgi:thymidylate synthase ThyX